MPAADDNDVDAKNERVIHRAENYSPPNTLTFFAASYNRQALFPIRPSAKVADTPVAARGYAPAAAAEDPRYLAALFSRSILLDLPSWTSARWGQQREE